MPVIGPMMKLETRDQYLAEINFNNIFKPLKRGNREHCIELPMSFYIDVTYEYLGTNTGNSSFCAHYFKISKPGYTAEPTVMVRAVSHKVVDGDWEREFIQELIDKTFGDT